MLRLQFWVFVAFSVWGGGEGDYTGVSVKTVAGAHPRSNLVQRYASTAPPLRFCGKKGSSLYLLIYRYWLFIKFARFTKPHGGVKRSDFNHRECPPAAWTADGSARQTSVPLAKSQCLLLDKHLLPLGIVWDAASGVENLPLVEETTTKNVLGSNVSLMGCATRGADAVQQSSAMVGDDSSTG